MHISLHLLFIKKNRLFFYYYFQYIYIYDIKELIEKDRNVENRYHTNNQIE